MSGVLSAAVAPPGPAAGVTRSLAVTASSWGVLMGISPVLQIRRMLHERSSRQVSLGSYAILIPVVHPVRYKSLQTAYWPGSKT